jgi:hypothetical protein
MCNVGIVGIVRHVWRCGRHGGIRVGKRALRVVGVRIGVHVTVVIVYRSVRVVVRVRVVRMSGILRSPPRSIAVVRSRY